MEPEVGTRLLTLAREAVVAAAEGHAPPRPGPELASEPELSAPRGAFVTLHEKSGALRGCIGTTQASDPLVEVVADMAQAAALRDPRFPPVRPDEVENLELEVSVLFPLEPIDEPGQVEVGTHGMVAEGRGRRGLLLPQVASERGWDSETFAAHTCMKAGLPPDAWQASDVSLFRFRSEVFTEDAPS